VVAAKTWIGTPSDGGWALTLLRYRYDTGEAFGSPVVWPSEPNSTNYFVPTAMEVVQGGCGGGGSDGTTGSARVIVTGYSQATQHGNTDFHTVCWGGSLGMPLWSHTHSRPGPVATLPGLVDDYPVDIAAGPGVNYYSYPEPTVTTVVGVTGNCYHAGGWDAHTILYDSNTGQILGMNFLQAGSAAYKVCGINIFPDSYGPYPNSRFQIAGTYTNPAIPGSNYLFAACYRAVDYKPSVWEQHQIDLMYTGEWFTANAMRGYAVSGVDADQVYLAGKASGIEDSFMFLARIDLFNSGDYLTRFSFDDGNPETPFAGEALALDMFPGGSGLPRMIAIGGHTRRDASRGNDAVVALYNENSGSPNLRWTAWLNHPSTPAFNISDVCSAVRIDLTTSTSPPGDPLEWFYVYAAGQVPTSALDTNTRIVVFSSFESASPTNPNSKPWYVDPLDYSGSASGGDLPRALSVNPFFQIGDPLHHLVVVSDVWNGSSTGFDVLTRRAVFNEEP
jgi:hypothetical protein